MARPVRVIVAKDLRFKFVSIMEDENRLAVRLLLPVPSDTAHSNISDKDFFSTKELLHQYVKQKDTLYFVQAEGVFDRTSRLGKLWWEAGANINFITDSYLSNLGHISVTSKHRCIPNSLERSNEWIKRVGKNCLCQIYCRSSSESIIDAAKSFPYTEEGMIFTNIDKNRFVPMTTEELWSNPNASSFFTTHPIIQVPTTVNPYEPFAGRITLLRGEDGQVATECTGDIWLVDSDSGYLPKKKVRVEKGIGYFWARALDLEEGDVMEFTVSNLAGHVFDRTETTVKEE